MKFNPIAPHSISDKRRPTDEFYPAKKLALVDLELIVHVTLFLLIICSNLTLNHSPTVCFVMLTACDCGLANTDAVSNGEISV